MPLTRKKRIITIATRKQREKKRIYTQDEYKSSDGMLTSVWGPGLWHFLHTMSFNYPIEPTQEDKTHYRNFILSLRNVLPCKYCRINLKTNFKQLPLTIKEMKNRESFSRYIYNLHELINHMLHKISNLSYNDVRERYEHFRARCTDEHPTIFRLAHSSTKTKKNKEKGCTEPLYGKKSKCIIRIVPQYEMGATFQMDKKCVKTKE